VKTKLKTAGEVLILLMMIPGSIVYGGTSQKNEIKEVIKAYGKAMNESNVNAVLSLYAKDGVFMPSELPTAIGNKQIKEAYEHEFNTIDLDVVVVFDEVIQEGDYAFVRTRSNGQIKILAKDLTLSTETYRAFFVLQKIKDRWKISRFMFNFTAPK